MKEGRYKRGHSYYSIYITLKTVKLLYLVVRITVTCGLLMTGEQYSEVSGMQVMICFWMWVPVGQVCSSPSSILNCRLDLYLFLYGCYTLIKREKNYVKDEKKIQT